MHLLGDVRQVEVGRERPSQVGRRADVELGEPGKGRLGVGPHEAAENFEYRRAERAPEGAAEAWIYEASDGSR